SRSRCGRGHDRVNYPWNPHALENHLRPSRRTRHPRWQLRCALRIAVYGHLLPTLEGRSLFGISHHVGPHLLREFAPARREIRGDDRMLALELERRDHREPDGAASDYQRNVTFLQARFFDRVVAYRHRLGKRGPFGG